MDKSLGTVVQFERFLTHAKLYSRATNTVRPYPLPPTPQTVLKPSRHNSFDLSTLYWVGRGEGTWICTFVHDCSCLQDLGKAKPASLLRLSVIFCYLFGF